MPAATPRETIFETERLYASRWRPALDAEAAHAIYSDPQVTRFIGGERARSPRPDVQRERLETFLERDRARAPGMGGFPLVRRSDEVIVGLALIKPLPDAEGRDTEAIEIGWHLGRAFWGHGYATEAGRGLLRHGFAALDVEALFAVVDPENTRSLAVVERLGMRAEGLTERYYGRSLALFVAPRSSANTGESVIT